MERMKLRDNPSHNALMRDVPFEVSKINSNLPYLTHVFIALILTWIFKEWTKDRVDLPRYQGRPPTEPYVRISRIRLFK